jgi:aryl-alcohol dehydrogenase-like predicted oxidoreductase
MYSSWAAGNKGGESETIIGNWLKRTGNRSKVIIATKLGMEMGPGEKGLSKPYIFRAAERSLERLRTDYIDLYQPHQDDATTPLEETLEAYGELIKQGKVRAIGASNYTADRLAAALEVSEKHGYPRYESLQPHYNLYERAGFEAALESVCLKKGVGVIPYFSLASGFLTGKYRSESDLSKSPRGQGVKKYLDERGLRILAALDQVAGELHSIPGKVSLAWLLARPSITAPIASATSVAQLHDLIDATNLTLDAKSIELLNQASAWSAATAS